MEQTQSDLENKKKKGESKLKTPNAWGNQQIQWDKRGEKQKDKEGEEKGGRG